MDSNKKFIVNENICQDKWIQFDDIELSNTIKNTYTSVAKKQHFYVLTILWNNPLRQ
jgi:capsular polysaccharide biosynthesis protein